MRDRDWPLSDFGSFPERLFYLRLGGIKLVKMKSLGPTRVGFRTLIMARERESIDAGHCLRMPGHKSRPAGRPVALGSHGLAVHSTLNGLLFANNELSLLPCSGGGGL